MVAAAKAGAKAVPPPRGACRLRIWAAAVAGSSLTGGAGADVFGVAVGLYDNGSTFSETDVITDFSIGTDVLLLPTGTSFANLTITQGTGADSANTIVATSQGTILAMLMNIEAAQVTAASFQ